MCVWVSSRRKVGDWDFIGCASVNVRDADMRGAGLNCVCPVEEAEVKERGGGTFTCLAPWFIDFEFRFIAVLFAALGSLLQRGVVDLLVVHGSVDL